MAQETIADRIEKLGMKSKKDEKKEEIEKGKREKFGNLLKRFQQVPGETSAISNRHVGLAQTNANT